MFRTTKLTVAINFFNSYVLIDSEIFCFNFKIYFYLPYVHYIIIPLFIILYNLEVFSKTDQFSIFHLFLGMEET